MNVLLIIVAVVSGVTAVAVGLFIVHELGWFPHGKERGPILRVVNTHSRFEAGAVVTHGHQVMQAGNILLRQHGHPEVYDLKDPVKALERVLQRYTESPTRSRYDDLIQVANRVGSQSGGEARVAALLDRVSDLALSTPFREKARG